MENEILKERLPALRVIIICRNKDETWRWLVDTMQVQLKLTHFNKTLKWALSTRSNISYSLVNRREELLGLEFHSYIIAPDYDDLVQEAKMRLHYDANKKSEEKLPKDYPITIP